jgi:hypothetical protein
MSDQLTKVAESAFERGIERFADRLFTYSEGESAFEACLREHPAGYMQLLDLAERAMRARNWFARHCACRFQPLPLVHYDEQEHILCSGDLHRHLVVYYSYSLRGQGFDYIKHPGFYEYGRGLLCDPACPGDLQNNRELMLDFPPKMLPGIAGIYWNPPEPLSKGLPPELKGRVGKARSREELINS